MKKKLYDILNGESGSKASFAYACVMVAFIAASLVPLCFRERIAAFDVIEWTCVVVFILDYIAR